VSTGVGEINVGAEAGDGQSLGHLSASMIYIHKIDTIRASSGIESQVKGYLPELGIQIA
jgi:hypothetical protein